MSADGRAVKVIYVYPPGRGPGAHACHWMAYHEGEESGGARGWGDTEREAIRDLRDNPKQRRP